MAAVIESVDESELEAGQNLYIRSYVDYSKEKALDGYSVLQSYSPGCTALLEQSYTKAQEWTPEFVKTKVETTVNGLDEYVATADELIEAALQRKDQFPQLLEELKKKLSPEEVLSYFENFKFDAGLDISSLLETLPSTKLTDIGVQERVQAIVETVLQQPQLIKETASKYVDDLHSNLDTDADGVVSVNDLASVSSTAVSYVGYIFAYQCILAEDVFSSMVEKTGSQDCVDRIQQKLQSRVQVQNVFGPLWAALEVLKQVFGQYQDNVKSSTPSYLAKLLGSAPVFSLPAEMIELLKILTGFVESEKKETVMEETRALFYALIDISFILEVLRQAEKQPVAQETGSSGIEHVSNQEALQDTKWMKSFQNLNFN